MRRLTRASVEAAVEAEASPRFRRAPPRGTPATCAIAFAAAVVAVNQAAISEAYKTIKADESGWIYKVRARPETMETARKLGLVMSEEQYLAMCDRQEEQEDAEASRSYP